jgi:hypothetical protein
MPYGPILCIFYICSYFQFPNSQHHSSLLCNPLYRHVGLILIFLEDPIGDCACVLGYFTIQNCYYTKEPTYISNAVWLKAGTVCGSPVHTATMLVLSALSARCYRRETIVCLNKEKAGAVGRISHGHNDLNAIKKNNVHLLPPPPKCNSIQ